MATIPPAPRPMFAVRLDQLEAIMAKIIAIHSPCPCATKSAGVPLSHDWSRGPHCAACGLFGFVEI